MTRKTFYRNLEKVAHKFNWELKWGKIRATTKDGSDTRFCPITAVGYALNHGKFEDYDYPKVAKLLNLSEKDADSIAGSADDCTQYNKIRVRRVLLSKVGLS